MVKKADKPVVKTLDFEKNKTEILTLPELEQTVSEFSTGGKPIGGLEHFELFNRIIEQAESHNVKYTVNPIYATDGGDKSLPGVTLLPLLEDNFGPKSLQSYRLRRVIGSIRIDDLNNGDSICQLAVSYHQKGIMVALGQHLNVCSNLNIYGIQNVIATYGDVNNKVMSIERILEVIGEWFTKRIPSWEQMLNYERQMKDIHMKLKDMEELIGAMTIMRVQRDSMHTVKNYALNQTQINQYVERFLDTEKHPIESLWDAYNLGTSFHRVGMTDLPLVIPNSVTFGQFVIDRYQLS